MPKISVLNVNGQKVKDIKLNDNIWSIEPNDAVIYDAIRLATASLRQGTHSVKTRAEVSGGGRKPWRQKGTGNARQGSTRSPQWRHGGIVFGPTTERNYNIKMNKKERRLALKSALSYKVIDSELTVLDELKLSSSKTKEIVKVLEGLKLNKSTLFVVNELTDELILASRNLEGVKVILPNEVNVLDVARYQNLVATEDAIKSIEEVLS
ncbi:MAG: 50S ribosomal protein L4 [Tenericutes bacterium]|nr:50S ribosomal protein L4 [Mycoplasmatota bacterium]MDD7630580.1 50S ribosomal protein L4 [bacterium]MDY4108213.1 50S ribosomal protein L4 [Bacilli bacterium]